MTTGRSKASSEVGGYYEPDSKTENHIGTVADFGKMVKKHFLVFVALLSMAFAKDNGL